MKVKKKKAQSDSHFFTDMGGPKKRGGGVPHPESDYALVEINTWWQTNMFSHNRDGKELHEHFRAEASPLLWRQNAGRDEATLEEWRHRRKTLIWWSHKKLYIEVLADVHLNMTQLHSQIDLMADLHAPQF